MKDLKQIAAAAIRASKDGDFEFLSEALKAMEIELSRLQDRDCAERMNRDKARPSED